jgi:hypothetical protein
MRPKLTAMLKELGAVSEEAKRAADRAPNAAAAAAPPVSGAEQIRTLIGQLTTPQMELAARPAPALVDDNTNFVQVDDEELSSNRTDLSLLSTDSVFNKYRRDAAAAAAPPAAAPEYQTPAAPAAAPPPVPAAPPEPQSAPPAGLRPNPLQQRQAEPVAPAPARQPPPLAAAARGPGRMVEVASTPPGALVVFDYDPSITCVAPCQIALTPGRHRLVATLEGHREALKILTVDEKKATSVVVDMVAKEGILTVESKPAGLPIFVNGKKTDRVTNATLTLMEGVYEIGVEVDGVLKTQTVSVKDGTLMKVPLE